MKNSMEIMNFFFNPFLNGKRNGRTIILLSYLDYWQKNVKRCNAGAIYNGDEMAMQARDEMAMHCIFKLSLLPER